ncbi:MAG: hypothetical protein PHZ23_16325 [Acidiphilium sp.]|nr:hypothetical protein [Acidiphilium sp.]
MTAQTTTSFNAHTLWMPRFFGGLAAFAVAFDIQRLFGDGMVSLAVSAVLLALGTLAWRGLAARVRGIEIEHSSAKRLAKLLPPGWSMQQSVPCPGGDVDILITDGRSTRYAIEIKSYRSFLLTDIRNVVGARRSGDKSRQTHEVRVLDQTKRAAWAANARPVLWLPRAKDAPAATVAEVLVIQGNAGRVIAGLPTPLST